MSKITQAWRDVLGPEISADLDDLARAHHDANPLTIIQLAVMDYIIRDCGNNEGVSHMYLFHKSRRQK